MLFYDRSAKRLSFGTFTIYHDLRSEEAVGGVVVGLVRPVREGRAGQPAFKGQRASTREPAI